MNAPAAFEEAPIAPDEIAPAAFAETPEAPDDVTIATLEISLKAAGDVAVVFGRRVSLVTVPDQIASSSYAITVEFAVMSLIYPILNFANSGLNLEAFDDFADFCRFETTSFGLAWQSAEKPNLQTISLQRSMQALNW